MEKYTAALTAITAELVQIPSVNPGYDPASQGERGMTAWLENWAKKNDFAWFADSVEEGRDNVYITLENGAGKHLLFNGHTDTVSIAGMVIEPFSGDIRDDRVWGRGASDMKGPLACMLQTLLYLRDHRERWQGTVTLSFVVDEELTFKGVRDLVARGRKYDFAIVGEPTRMQVLRGCKGVLRFTVQARGVSAHSSTPQLGRSAIVAMGEAVVRLNQWFGETLSLQTRQGFGSSTGSIGLIRGGAGVNIVAEKCAIEVDVRLIPGQDGADTFKQICEVVHSCTTQVPEIEWVCDPNPFIDEAYETAEDDVLVRSACSALGLARSDVAHYTCDASKIARGGIPCIILGPGCISAAHTTDESIAIADLEAGMIGYIKVVEELLACAR